jgi:hypothetical protein
MDSSFSPAADVPPSSLPPNAHPNDNTIPSHPADAPPTPPQLFRVKLYKLDVNGQWDDLGTGQLTARFADLSLLVLTVRADEGERVLVEHKVDPHTEYDRQGETILTWSESETEYALSFQEVDGCLQVWERVMYAQGKTEDELLAGSETLDQEVSAKRMLGCLCLPSTLFLSFSYLRCDWDDYAIPSLCLHESLWHWDCSLTRSLVF